MNHKSLFLLSALIYLALSCTNKRESITPEIKNITESVYSSGIVKGKNKYEVFGRTNAIVQNVFVTEGMPIKKGDPIFQLDNKDLRVATENERLAPIAADYKVNADKLLDAGNAIEIAEKQVENDSLQYQ